MQLVQALHRSNLYLEPTKKGEPVSTNGRIVVLNTKGLKGCEYRVIFLDEAEEEHCFISDLDYPRGRPVMNREVIRAAFSQAHLFFDFAAAYRKASELERKHNVLETATYHFATIFFPRPGPYKRLPSRLEEECYE